jgi:hypothetical protein
MSRVCFWATVVTSPAALSADGQFYTFLYKRAKEHKPDYSGFAGVDYQADRETAKNSTENYI